MSKFASLVMNSYLFYPRCVVWRANFVRYGHGEMNHRHVLESKMLGMSRGLSANCAPFLV